MARRYGGVGVNLKFLKEKVKGKDRDVSTVVLRVFLSRTFPFVFLMSIRCPPMFSAISRMNFKSAVIFFN